MGSFCNSVSFDDHEFLSMHSVAEHFTDPLSC